MATILQKAALQAGLDIHLAAISKTESGSASGGGCWGYRKKYYWDEKCDPDDYNMEDVHDITYKMRDWICLDGSRAVFQESEFELDEVLQVEPPHSVRVMC